ncbi:unnamed protein product [Sphagnum troendelagicum]
MASGNAQSGKEESWLLGLEQCVEGFWSGIFPTHKAVAGDSTDCGTIELKGTLTLRKRLLLLNLTDLGRDAIDDLSDVLGGKVSVELVSSTSVDPKTRKGLQSPAVKIANWSEVPDFPVEQDIKFDLTFHVAKDFGVVGAIIVHNGHPFEFLLVSFSLALPDQSTVIYFRCNSWVYNTSHKPGRIFFSNQVYLPSQTPAGLVALRAEELNNLRGDGTGVRRVQDRIYDYAVYNDLGNPDHNPSYKRPILGGSEEFPYPRRCRTGRPPTKTVPESESPPPPGIPQWTYIPRDEAFAQYKNDDFVANTIIAGLESLTSKALMWLAAAMEIKEEVNFENFEQIFKMYAPKGVIKGLENLQLGGSNNIITHPLKFIRSIFNGLEVEGDPSSMLYPLPGVVAEDEVSWSTDAEFTREFVAGLNPMVITRVTEFPLKSQMDPFQYGDPVSAITAKHVNRQLPDGWNVYTALAAKKLFVVDYHDTYITYINRINAQPGVAFYASRTLLFLTSDGTLQVLAIELTLPPPAPGGAKNSRVFLPPDPDSTKNWVWELAKAHVISNDSAFHQVVNHFTRTHAVVEPIIIATNRQLSALHPINLILVPHFKNTMDINSAARQSLINAGGIIESSFTPGKYCLELGAVVYKRDWRFDEQGLPTDLVKRGMAIPDSSAKHGLQLLLEDYPYAVDGLDLWVAIETWYTDFVDIAYANDAEVVRDVELQNWWTEVRTVGHADKKDAPGWPELNSKKNLVQICVTIAWVASCHHAAVNFGQYQYAGFMPNHPTCMRRLIPEENTVDWNELQAHPKKFYFETVSSQAQAITVMTTIQILSNHAYDEEYLGQRNEANWTNDEKILTAFKKYHTNITKVDELIKGRNADKTLKNRYSPVQLEYELLRPHSEGGLTGRGVPNSVSI